MVRAFAHGAMGRLINPSWWLFLAPASAHDWCNKGRGMCYSVYGMMHIKEPISRRIDPSWWTHWAISRSSQCSTTGVTKAVVCVILSMDDA